MAGFIAAIGSMGVSTTAFNLLGNLGVRTVSKWAPSYSGAVLAGISSTAFFVLGHMTSKAVISDGSGNVSPKRNLYILTVTLIGGAALPHLLAPLTKSKISLTASIVYSILGHFGNNFGLSVVSKFEDSPKTFSKSLEEFRDEHLEIWNYLTSSKA